MLTWEKIYEWCQVHNDHYPARYSTWFWTAFLATYGHLFKWELTRAAADLAAQHREHPDYSVGPGVRYCLCHQRPHFYESGHAVWHGDPSAAAWHHFPLVKAYFLALLAGNDDEASRYLMEFAGWRQSLMEAYNIALSIGDIARAHALARQIVDDHPQTVYFLCRKEVNDPELLERARAGLMKDPNLHHVRWCAEATKDTEFIARIKAKAALAAS